MSDRTALSLVIHATDESDRDGIRSALAAHGLDGLVQVLSLAPGTACEAEEVAIEGGRTLRALAESLAANTRHTAFQLWHYPDRSNVGHYAAYVPGHGLYIAPADADGDPYIEIGYLAEQLAEAPPAMTVREWRTARGPALLGAGVHLAQWHMARRRTAEDLMEWWRQTRDSAEAAWEEILADKIRRHPAYLHPVYPMAPALARFWGADGKRGPVWDSTGVHLLAEDGTELCTFDLGDSPETTAALEALTELWPPRWEEDERDTLL